MKILICPLNWGLGHASRDIPIIQKLIDKGHEVIIAADGPALEILKGEFTELETVIFPSSVYITYFRTLPAWLKIILLTPLLALATLREHHRLKRIVRDTGADLVISDNRYGLWHTRIPSILITHQLNPRLPSFMKFLERPVAGMFHRMIKQFHRCWVPDSPGESNLTGNLGHKYLLPENVVFTGPLSRFTFTSSNYGDPVVGDLVGKNGTTESNPERDMSQTSPELLILISGPESQRTKLEKIILGQIGAVSKSTIILQGLPGQKIRREIYSNVTVFSHLPSDKIKLLLESTQYIICRGGYTSIMDIVCLGKSAMIIPTPGQTEQEYLADYLSAKGILLAMDQKSFDLKKALEQLELHKSIKYQPERKLLDEEMGKWF
jgi:UDP:flavonoid glycosyltransferase YjiC (YdhE family)